MKSPLLPALIRTVQVGLLLVAGCARTSTTSFTYYIQDVAHGLHRAEIKGIWLTHEHVLVDFIGADASTSSDWNIDTVLAHLHPYFDTIGRQGVTYVVDATPAYLGRDPILLKRLSEQTGLRILTTTGLYGAREDKFIPTLYKNQPSDSLAAHWIKEFRNGIADTGIRPGLIKIGVDQGDTLTALHQRLVRAAARTHLATGMAIMSHTGKANALWPQLALLQEEGVSPKAFIWAHAQAEDSIQPLVQAAHAGCWIGIDGLAWDTERCLTKVIQAKQRGILHRVLLSHDAGWYRPREPTQSIRSYATLVDSFIPKLRANGFTTNEINQLVRVNPLQAFGLQVRTANVNEN